MRSAFPSESLSVPHAFILQQKSRLVGVRKLAKGYTKNEGVRGDERPVCPNEIPLKIQYHLKAGTLREGTLS